MSKPIGYNVPEGVDAESFLSDELLSMLGESFAGVTDAFGDDATLYKIDIGKIIESVQAGGLIISGQFVDKSDGEIFNFEINQDSNQLRYRSAGEFLEEERLAVIRGESSADDAEGNSTSDLRRKGQQLYDLLYEAVNDRDSEAGQSPFGIKLSKDLDYLAALSAAMYHAGITIEAQPLYAGLHSYAIKYTLGGLRLFSDVIGAMEGPEAEALANRWIDENGLGFAASFVKAFSSQRCESMREQIQAGNQLAIEDIKAVLEEGLGMAMACTTDLIRTIAEAEDYEEGDVQVTLAAAIEEYCPIDNSDGYHVSINPRQLSTEWQEVVKQSGCAEDLSMQALGLPSADTAGSEPASSITGQARSAGDEPVGDDATTDGARIFYVNVGEGPSRNWDDCRQFGFLAAGGGRKWSKQLEKIKTGDTVIAYLKGYGYVGIGKVVTASTPATKFMVNGVPIRELPLVNDTIRSIKRFSKENGEYLIGVDWQSAVPREKGIWQTNAGLYTTALVCASLANQPATVVFATEGLKGYHQAAGSDVSCVEGDAVTNAAPPANIEYINGAKYYNPSDYGWDIEEAFSFPPGRYFLGDPGHALTGDQYQEACEISYNDSGEIDGVGEVAIFKCPGDGQYEDEDGFIYAVGSGTLGVVPINHLAPDQIHRLRGLGRILDLPGQADNPNWEDDGDGFQAMIDSQGHIFLGCAWIFCGDEHPLKAEFWKFLEEASLDDCGFWPSEVTKVIDQGRAIYLGRCQHESEDKCFIIDASSEAPLLKFGPIRDYRFHETEITGYVDKPFEERWISLCAIQGMTSTV